MDLGEPGEELVGVALRHLGAGQPGVHGGRGFAGHGQGGGGEDGHGEGASRVRVRFGIFDRTSYYQRNDFRAKFPRIEPKNIGEYTPVSDFLWQSLTETLP